MLTFLRKKMKMIMIVIAVLFVASMFYGIGATRWSGEGGKKSSGLAKINGVEIDPLRFRENINRLMQQFGMAMGPSEMAFIENMALGQTLDFTMMLEEAKKKVRVSNREVDAVIDNIMQQNKIPSKKEFELALKKMGMEVGKFRDMIKDEMLVQKLMAKIRQEATVTPDDLREIKASHILVSAEALAKELKERLNKGQDFASLAKKYSIDLGSAVKGGDLGFFATGAMVAPFEKVAFKLKPGEISELVKTQFGYHIIKVTDSRLRKFPGKETDYQKAALAEKQEKAFKQWYSEQQRKAKLEIESPELKGNSYRFKGMLAEAIAEYKKAIIENPNNAYLYVFLADSYVAMRQTELALPEYEKAITMAGGNPQFYFVLAQAYEKLGKRDLALKQYRQASVIAGDNKALHQQLLSIFQKLNAAADVANEKAEIKRIERKEAFEKGLKGGN